MKNPPKHSVVTLNMFGVRRPELAVIFQGILEYMDETQLRDWQLTVVEDVGSEEPQDMEETLDAMLGNEEAGFEEFLKEEGLI